MKDYTKLIIREIKPDEYSFLEEMLYQAIFVDDEKAIIPRKIIREPELKIYIENFGKKGDFCLVAEQDNKLIGAIWTRLIKAYGFVDSETPELSMAVLKEHRNKGIGKQLLKTLIERLKNSGFKRISLSVDKENFAYGFYKKHGFRVVSESGDSMIMAREF